MSDGCRLFLSCVPPTANHQRKKIVRIKLRDGRQFTKLADKPELVAAKHSLDELLIPHQMATPVPTPVALTVTFIWPWLSGHSKRFRAAGRQPHTSKPDCSNALKTLEDRLVALRFIEDDRGVVDVRVLKFWGDTPGIEIEIRPFDVREAPPAPVDADSLFAGMEA